MSRPMDTPPHVVAAAVDALGTVDLFAVGDAMPQSWSGAVFMHPPYGRAIGGWVAKLLAEYDAGHVSAFVTLLPARTDTRWWSAVSQHFPIVCLIRGRLHFGGAKSGAPFPSAAVYCGPDADAFRRAFSALGLIYERYKGGSS